MSDRMRAGAMRIRLDVGGTPLAATLDDTEVARDFASLLPLALTLADYAATEKVADLPRRLSTRGAPPGTAASAGDIMHYAPWGNVALFYRDAGYAAGLVKLGWLDDPEAGAAVLRQPGSLRLTIDIEKE
jgi:hypothetical protein